MAHLDKQSSDDDRSPLTHDPNLEKSLRRREAVLLRGKVVYRNNKLLPCQLADIIPPRGKKTEFPFLMENPTGVPYLRLAVRTGHGRTAVLGAFDVVDEWGNHFVFGDAKGIGYVYAAAARDWYRHKDDSVKGILTKDFVERDLLYSELFAQHGVGGHRVVAIIEPDALPVRIKTGNIGFVPNRNLVSPREQKDILQTDISLPDKAVIEIRLFTEQLRLGEIYSTNLPALLDRLNARFGIHLQDGEDYVLWLAERVARAVAIMHKRLRCTHKYLTEHNILADGLIVDDDSVTGPDDYGLSAEALTDQSELLDPNLEPNTFGRRIEKDREEAISSLFDPVLYCVSELRTGIKLGTRSHMMLHNSIRERFNTVYAETN